MQPCQLAVTLGRAALQPFSIGSRDPQISRNLDCDAVPVVSMPALPDFVSRAVSIGFCLFLGRELWPAAGLVDTEISSLRLP